MKKRIIGIIAVLITMVLLIVLTGCSTNKTAIAISDFEEKMKGKGYTIQDATQQFSEYDYVKRVSLALSDDLSYQIEFYELADEDSAVSFFNNNKAIFENSKGSGSSETSTSMGNNSKYTLTTNGKYKVVSRIDNTVIYLNVDEEYKDTVKDLLEELGY